MMKRWISLMLALVMVLSLMTGFAGAEGVEEGIYLDSGLTKYVEGRRWFDGGPYGYTLYYTPGEDLTFYYFSPDPVEIDAGGDLQISATEVDGGVLAAVTLPAGPEDAVQTGMNVGDNGFPIMFVPEPVREGVYTDASMSERVNQTEENGKTVYTVPYDEGEQATAAFYSELDFSMDLSIVEVSPDLCDWDKFDYYDGQILRLDLSDTAEGEIEIPVTLQDANGNSKSFVIRFTSAQPQLGATENMKDIWLPGTMFFDFLLDGEVVADDRITEIEVDLEGAEILRIRDLIAQGDTHVSLEWGQFMINANRAYPQQEGSISLKIDGKPYSMEIATSTPVFGFYTGGDFSPESYLIPRGTQSVFFESGEPQTIWFQFTKGEKIRSVTSSSNLMQITHNDPYIASFTVDPNFKGSFDTYLEVESENGRRFGIDLSITNVKVTTIPGGPIDRGTQVQALWTGSGISEPFYINGYEDPFYMGIGSPDASQPGNLGGMEPPMEPSDVLEFATQITFYTYVGDRIYQRVDDDTLADILEAFGGTLSKNLYGLDGVTFEGLDEPKFYPTLHVMDDAVCTTTAEMTVATFGAWMYRATGTLYGETEVAVNARFDWRPRSTILEFTPEATEPAAILQEINDFLQTYVDQEDVQQIVYVPEGEYTGQIIVGDNGWGLEIVGQGTVILHGGVVNNSGDRSMIRNIHFVGAGANNKTWTSGVLEGMPNIAIRGNGGGRVENSTFSGYDYAIYTDMITGVVDCAFSNNNVAIMEDHEDGGGNPDLANNVFERNKIALNFEHIADRLSTVFFNISHNKFIDNQWDVRNKLKRSLYLPGNFFGRTDEDGNLEAVPCNHQIGSGEVVTMLDDTEIDLEDTSFNTQIFAYPRATDPSCRTWVKEETAVLYNGHAAEFQIAEENVHGTTFIVMDEESELVQMVFPEAAPISMLAEGGQFDASVGFQTSDENDLVLMINDTLGLNPLVRLPLTGSDVQVLDPDGNEIETNYQDGYVEFTAGKGGDYTMAASLRVNRLNAHMMAVNLGSRGTGKQVVVAVYEPSGKLADLQIPEDVTGFWMYENQDLDLTACEVKVMLVDGDYVPGCEAVTLEAAAE